MVRIFKAIILVIISQTLLPAQVKLMLEYNAVKDEYAVSMMPERTWRSPYNKTATGQITLKATTGQFFVNEVVSHLDKTEWVTSGRVNSPVESPKYDYIFFRLRTPGLVELPYRAFRPVKLFSFTLESNCAREVMLVSNFEDPFLPPNSRSVNIGNSIGVLGARGEAYIGNVSDMPIFCPYAAPPKTDVVTDLEGTEKVNVAITEAQPLVTLIADPVVYPNPTINEVDIALQWNGTAGKKGVIIFNSAGEMVRELKRDLQRGPNQFKLDLRDLDNGIYSFILVDNNDHIDIGKVIKIQ